MANSDSPVFAAGGENWNQLKLSKREYFAAIALQGYIASYAGASSIPHPEVAANKAIQYADALIKALNEKYPTQ